MWIYEKKLQYPVNIKTPNARLAKVIISQLGGPDDIRIYFHKTIKRRWHPTLYFSIGGKRAQGTRSPGSARNQSSGTIPSLNFCMRSASMLVMSPLLSTSALAAPCSERLYLSGLEMDCMM